MKKQIFFHSELYKQLQARLTLFIGRVDAAGEVIREHFPSVPWNTKTLWILFGERTVRDYLCDQLNRQEADALGLECEWGREENPKPVPRFYGFVPASLPEPASPQAIAARQFVRTNTRKDRGAIGAFAWDALDVVFLRTSVVTISRSGETVVARDADARLRDFCTLFAETGEQEAFVGIVERMRDHAAGLMDSFTAFRKTALDNGTADLLKGLGWEYNPLRFCLIGGFCGGGMRLDEEDVIPRALITFFHLSRAVNGAPKFYNRSGYCAYNPEDLNAITGRAAAGCEMRARLPYIYDDHDRSRVSEVSPRLIKEG